MADLRHKRDTDARWSHLVSFIAPHRRAALIAAPLATLATVGAVGVGMVNASSGSSSDNDQLMAISPLSASLTIDTEGRKQSVSRSQDRTAVSDLAAFEAAGQIEGVQDRFQAAAARRAAKAEAAATAAAVEAADTKLWATADLNVWTASAGGSNVDVLSEGKKVLITGRERDGRTEIVLGGESRWVTSGYLTDEKPTPETTTTTDESTDGGTAALGGSCSNGTSVPSGVSPNIVKVHEAVCAAFPEITAYGTFRGDGEHAQGLAVDIMVSGDRGWQVADFVRAHYSELGVNYVIYSQHIWSVDRSGEGWRGMEDRGSTTANHYDHVHVTTY